MRTFLRAVISGFGWSLGAAIYRKVSDRLAQGEQARQPVETPNTDQVASSSEKDESRDAETE